MVEQNFIKTIGERNMPGADKASDISSGFVNTTIALSAAKKDRANKIKTAQIEGEAEIEKERVKRQTILGQDMADLLNSYHSKVGIDSGMENVPKLEPGVHDTAGLQEAGKMARNISITAANTKNIRERLDSDILKANISAEASKSKTGKNFVDRLEISVKESSTRIAALERTNSQYEGVAGHNEYVKEYNRYATLISFKDALLKIPGLENMDETSFEKVKNSGMFTNFLDKISASLKGIISGAPGNEGGAPTDYPEF